MGEGIIDYPTFFDALQEVGFQALWPMRCARRSRGRALGIWTAARDGLWSI